MVALCQAISVRVMIDAVRLFVPLVKSSRVAHKNINTTLDCAADRGGAKGTELVSSTLRHKGDNATSI